MKQALNKTQAVAGGKGRMARLVRHGVLACMLAGAGAGALAQNYERGGHRRDEAQQRFQMQGQDMRGFDDRQRAYEEARQRAFEDQQRRQMQMDREQREPRGERRMTPDERSDLRRQINEARKDLYPNAQRR
jgi:hypothetical protein